MSAYRTWPIAVLAIAVAYYLWNSDDEPAPEQAVQQEHQPAISPPLVRQSDTSPAPQWKGYGDYQSPTPPYDGYSLDYRTPSGSNRSQYSSTGGYRFRPSNDKGTYADPFGSSYPAPHPGQDYSRTTNPQLYQDLSEYGMAQQPTGAYRFRPLDKKQQRKRWTGNYAPQGIDPRQPPTPYIHDRYPVPAYPSHVPPEPNPLWANSWSER